MHRLWLGVLFSGCLAAQQSTHYVVQFPNAVHHEAEIAATFTGITSPTLTVVMSRSSPGRYALAEFAKNIYNVRAHDVEGRHLPVAHPDPYSWQVSGHHGTVVFEYTLFGNHTDGTYAAIDETHAHLNMPATFAWARGFSDKPFLFTFQLPPERQWKIATQLLPNDDGTFRAPNLEWMMDSPVEISNHVQIEWKIEDAVFRLALHHGGTEQEAQQYARLCEAAVLEEEGVFGALPKFDGGTYTFLADFLPYAFGDGMEHRNSTVMTAAADLHSSAKRLAGTASHEFFHAWNVRRMRPRALEPFDFERANMSAELWFAEGFTNYYGLLALERAGISSLDEFAGGMGRAVDAVLTAPGRKFHSAVEMSELAPFVDAAKSVDETNFGNTFISYYTYGQALALGIDLTIRQHFPGKSLDDWMREVWREHPDIERPYTLADLESALAKVTGDAQFATAVFRNYIFGKEPMNYGAVLATAGLRLRKAHPGKAWLGTAPEGESATFATNASGIEIKAEPPVDSPLFLSGLGQGDVVLKWNGTPVGAQSAIGDLLQKHHPGDRVRVTARTRAGEKTVQIALIEDPHFELVTFEKAGEPVTPEMLALRKDWLSSKALHPLPKLGEGAVGTR